MVTCLLSISYIDAYIIMDTGFTYSYISVDFVQSMNKKVGYLDSSIMVAVLVGGFFIV